MIKNYNVIVTIILIVFIFFTLKECKSSKDFKAKISVLERYNDSLKGLYQKEQKYSDSLFKIKNKTIVEYETIYKYLKPIKDEQNNLPDSVYSLNEQQIDRTIRAYKRSVGN